MPSHDWETSSSYSLKSSSYVKVEQTPTEDGRSRVTLNRSAARRLCTLAAKASVAPLILALFGLTVAVIIAGSSSSLLQALPTDAFGCDANGGLWAGVDHKPSNWDTKYALSITLAFGRLSYPAAKAIDITWDLVVGRISQMIGMVVIYRIFRRVVMQDLQQGSIPLSKLLSLQYNTISWTGLLSYTKDVDWLWLWKPRSSRDFMTGLTLVVSTLYAIFLPVWLSSMTGYQAITTPGLPMGDGAMVSPLALQLCAYVIEDGDRIGLWQGYCVTEDSNMTSAFQEYYTENVENAFWLENTATSWSNITVNGYWYNIPALHH